MRANGFLAGLVVGVAATVVVVAVLGGFADSGEEALEARNAEIAVEFYDRFLNQKDWAAVSELIGEDYIQHNPNAVDGHEGVRNHIEYLRTEYPENHGDIKRVIADGNLVALHIHSKRTPDSLGNAVVDIFRIEDGKVMEHWDVVQPVPETAQNDNTMF